EDQHVYLVEEVIEQALRHESAQRSRESRRPNRRRSIGAIDQNPADRPSPEQQEASKPKPPGIQAYLDGCLVRMVEDLLDIGVVHVFAQVEGEVLIPKAEGILSQTALTRFLQRKAGLVLSAYPTLSR